MQRYNPQNIFTSILNRNTPVAIAFIQGSSDYANLYGTISFYETPFGGALVSAEVYGLPGSGFFGMHIHEFGDCSQNIGNVLPPSGVIQPRSISQSPDSMMAPDNMQAFRSIRPPMDMQAFPNTGNHYNPNNVPHPEHAGDLPPLLSNNGYAWMSFYTGRVNLNDVIGRSLVIHGMADDFRTQPSGNSGDKIACGVIEAR